MSTRKIIDAKQNGEKVWLKGHAKATFMSDGTTVEDAINSIQTGTGGIITETDPVFSASPAASITESKKTEWDNKVDKVSGKQLSTEDFTTALKNKLEGLNNYDDTELSEAIKTLRGDFDNIVSGDTTTAIKTFNEVIAFLDGLTDTQDLKSIIASIEQQIAGKQNELITYVNNSIAAIEEWSILRNITFYLNDTKFETEEGSIWVDLINEGKFMNSNGYVCTNSGVYIMYNGSNVSINDVVIASGSYSVSDSWQGQ